MIIIINTKYQDNPLVALVFLSLHTRFERFTVGFLAVMGFISSVTHHKDLISRAALAFFVVAAVTDFA